MNKIYRVIWSKAKNCYVVASELAKRNGKSAQKAVVGAVIAGVFSAGVLGFSTSAMAADFGNSYDAAAMLSAVTTDDGTGLGFSMVRGDKQYDVIVGTLGVEIDDEGKYRAGYYVRDTSYGSPGYKFTAFEGSDSGNGTVKSAYDIVEALAKDKESAYYQKSIYFSDASLPAYLKNVKGYSDDTIAKVTLDSGYKFTMVEAEATAEFNKTLVEKTETMVHSTVGQLLKPGENVALQKVGHLTQKDEAGNILGYVDKDGNLIKNAAKEVITGPYEGLTDAEKALVDEKGLPTEYDIHAADSQTTVSASGSNLVLTQKIADIDTDTGNAKLDENGKFSIKRQRQPLRPEKTSQPLLRQMTTAM